MASSASTVRDLPGYKVHSLIGKGSQGSVYRATQLSMDRDVAIKFLSPKFARNPGSIEKFIKEARAAAKLSHPNIILGIDVGEHKGVYYFVMEYVEGQTLKQILAKRKTLPEPEALRLAAQVALALDQAHRSGFVHRDVKPANIMVTPDGTAKLCDLGLAVSLKDDAGKPRSLAGTPYYISPEQARCDKEIDIRADIYSLGATLYHALVGEPPFRGEAPEHVIARHLTDPPTPPRARRADISRRTNDLILKMLEKARDKRPQTPKALSDELRRLAEYAERQSIPGSRRPVADRIRRKPFNPVPLIVAVGLLVLGGITLLIFKDTLFPPKNGTGGSGPRPSTNRSNGSTATDTQPKTEAEQELAILEEQVQADPSFERMGDIIFALEQFKEQHGAAWGLKADQLKSRYLEALEAHLRPKFDALKKRDRELMAQVRWREALEVYEEFPGAFIDLCPAGRAVKERRAELRDAIGARTQKDRARVNELTEQAKLKEALTLLDTMGLYGLEGTKPWIRSKRSEIDSEIKKELTAQRQVVERAYTLMERDFRDLMARREFGPAIDRVRAFLRRDWSDVQLELLTVDGFDPAAASDNIVERCERVITDDPPTVGMSCVMAIRNAAEVEAFVAQAEAALPGLVDARARLTLSLGTGFFRRAGDGGIEFVIEGRRRDPFDVRKARVSDLELLANRAPGVNPSGVRHIGRVGLACFYSGEEDLFSRATELLKQAADGGYPGARHYAKNMAEVRDRRIGELIKGAWELANARARAGLWPEVEELLAMIDENGAHPAARALADPLKAFRKTVTANAKKVRAIEEELNGTVTTLLNGRATLVYDFASRKQFEDFEPIKEHDERRLSGRWRWVRGRLESSDKTSAVVWKRAVSGDVTVAYDLKSRDFSNIVTTLYYSPKASRHYSFTLGLDVIGGRYDPKNTREDKENLPRNCIVKYPTGVEWGPMAWERRSFWTAWRRAMVGAEVKPFTFTRGEVVRVRAERVGDLLRFQVGENVIWEGKDTDYKEGAILFFSNSRITMENLSITFSVE